MADEPGEDQLRAQILELDVHQFLLEVDMHEALARLRNLGPGLAATSTALETAVRDLWRGRPE